MHSEVVCSVSIPDILQIVVLFCKNFIIVIVPTVPCRASLGILRKGGLGLEGWMIGGIDVFITVLTRSSVQYM